MTLLSIALIVAGAAIAAFATSLIIRPMGWSRTTGTIVGLSSSAPSWAPHRDASFRYTSDDGTEHTIWSPDATGGSGAGGPVQVRYDPKDPARARPAAALPQVFILITIGDVLLAAGIILLVL